jgi:type IV secretory pathway VirB4 component
VNAADTLPLVGTSCGSPSGLHLGYADPGRTLERLDPFDPLHDNGTLIVNGKSGGGKTFLVQALLSQALPLGAQAAVIDRSAGHYRFLCDLVPGARHVQVGGEEGVTVNPWDVEDLLAVPGSKVAFLVRLHTLLIGDHHASADAFGLSPLERNLLELAIRGVYQDAVKTSHVPCESYLREQLVQRAADEARAVEGSQEVAATYRSLAERLHAFCADGSYGALLDRPTTVDLEDAPLVVFDTSSVPEEVSPALLFALSEHLAGHIERRREAHLHAGADRGQGMFAGRFVLVLEELWKLVERRATGAWINELARRARHLGLFLVCVTQQRSDLAGPWGKALLDNSTMQLFLRQSPDELAYLRDALKLTDAEVAQIAHLKTDKRRAAQAYFINGTRGRGTVSVRLGPRAYWVCTSDPIADVPEREEELRAAGEEPWAALSALGGT